MNESRGDTLTVVPLLHCHSMDRNYFRILYFIFENSEKLIIVEIGVFFSHSVEYRFRPKQLEI